jgi:sugar lactone lactonase YvrE
MFTSGDLIGEGPTWDAAREELLWSDNPRGIIHVAARNSDGSWREVRRYDLGRHIAAALPRRGGGYLVPSGDEILALNDDGAVALFARLSVDPAIQKINDAKCDPQGRLWVGTSDRDFGSPGKPITPGRCAMFRIDADGSVHPMFAGGTLLNGMGWSPDGTIFYSADSFDRTVDAFDFDGTSGTSAHRRTVVRFAQDDGIPDGLCVDAEGCLWIAVPGEDQIRRYAPTGELLAAVTVPGVTLTSCSFCGPELEQLAITSSSFRLAEESRSFSHGFRTEQSTHPAAGALYVCELQVAGAALTPFAGEAAAKSA